MHKRTVNSSDDSNQMSFINRKLFKNVDELLNTRQEEIIKLINLANSISFWKAMFKKNPAAKLVDEIYVDIFFSTYFTCSGLYKYADMALRSALEDALNAIYFYHHPMEFSWWDQGKEWYIDNKDTHTWGKGFDYFKIAMNGKAADLFKKGRHGQPTTFPEIYGDLSKSIHSTSTRLQTKQQQTSPSFNLYEFQNATKRIRMTTSLINTMMTIFFYKIVNAASSSQSSDAKNDEYKEHINPTLLDKHISILKGDGMI